MLLQTYSTSRPAEGAAPKVPALYRIYFIRPSPMSS